MFSSVLLALAFSFVIPWLPGDVPQPSPVQARLPVEFAVDAPSSVPTEGFDPADASRRVMEGAAARLQARGVAVAASKPGVLRALPTSTRVAASALSSLSRRDDSLSGPAVSLHLSFNSASTPWASGTETYFGGESDAAWRLAAQVQQHLTGGLRQVLSYDSYDRGVVEEIDAGPSMARPPSVQPGDSWVSAYPLFVTNLRERGLLEWPDTLEVLSSALADAVADYLDPFVRTPPRNSYWGWRSESPWRPVSPRVVNGAEKSPRLALTFDGGASSAPTPAILKALRDAGVRATMFMTADFVEKNPELVIQMAREGHEFGNHSSTHPNMTGISSAAMVAELDRLETSVRALTGRSTRPWFRPPYGAYDDRVVRTAAGQGYYTVMWTTDSADWRPELSADIVERRLLTYAAPGAILIEHLGSPQSAQVLPDVLKQLKTRGFTFGTLSEVVGSLE